MNTAFLLKQFYLTLIVLNVFSPEYISVKKLLQSSK